MTATRLKRVDTVKTLETFFLSLPQLEQPSCRSISLKTIYLYKNLIGRHSMATGVSSTFLCVRAVP